MIYFIIVFFLIFSLQFVGFGRLTMSNKFILNLFTISIGLLKIYWIFNQVGTDSRTYFQIALEEEYVFGIGTAFVGLFTKIFVFFLGEDFISVSIAYIVFPMLGNLLIYNVIKGMDSGDKYRAFVFFPTIGLSIAFWGSGITKDAFSVLGIALIIHSLFSSERKQYIKLVIGLVLVFLVRPHIAFLFLCSFMFAIMVSGKIALSMRTLIFAFSSLSLYFIFPVILNYIGLKDGFSFEAFSERLDDRVESFEGTGSFIDLQNMSIAMRVFTFLVRPLPFEANGIAQGVASLQNVIILIVLVKFVLDLAANASVLRSFVFSALTAYSLAAALILAYALSNLGLATRQKLLVLEVLVPLALQLRSVARSGKRLKRTGLMAEDRLKKANL